MSVVSKCSLVNRSVQFAPIRASFPDFLLFIPLPQASEYPSPWQHSIRLVGGVITAGFPTEGLSHMDYLWTCMTTPDPLKYFSSKFLLKARDSKQSILTAASTHEERMKEKYHQDVPGPSSELPCLCLKAPLAQMSTWWRAINHKCWISQSETGKLCFWQE